MHEKPTPQGHLDECRWYDVVLAARVGVLVVLAAFVGSCVNLKYPTATPDGGVFIATKSRGDPCRKGAECQSGLCVDGVCCKTECTGECVTCSKSGAEGVCNNSDVDTNPRNACRAAAVETCGLTGVCDGAGFCQKYSAGLTCSAAMCNAPSVLLASRCDGNGMCVAGATQKCDPYVCGAEGKCLTQCTTDKDCNGGACLNGSCGKKALGTACADKSECVQGFCEQGVCCATACTGMGDCQSCALPGSEGACTPVPSGGASKLCSTTDVSMCGTDGTCDGAGGCRLFQTGTMCSPASCSTATLRNAGKCDGKGHCQVPATSTCGGYTCASASACRVSCGTDADCAAPSVCGQSTCGGLTAQYFRQTNLTDLAFTRTDPQINFNWMGGSPSPLLNVDNFSIRWTGKLTPRFSEVYTFYAATDDGERLWIDGKLLIDHYIRKPSVPDDVGTTTYALTAGMPVDIKLEYFESGGDASAMLSWSSPSETPKSVIPTSALAPQ
jgi:PA14 domain